MKAFWADMRTTNATALEIWKIDAEDADSGLVDWDLDAEKQLKEAADAGDTSAALRRFCACSF